MQMVNVSVSDLLDFISPDHDPKGGDAQKNHRRSKILQESLRWRPVSVSFKRKKASSESSFSSSEASVSLLSPLISRPET
ncbi:hypothetical protein SOVF_059790 [Spinacia oleracea]|nr:hypothetical protein SOVF_059790 [Spinacia oleracea]